jgi:hypothetical protein
MASASLREPKIPRPAMPTPLPIPASKSPPARRSSGLRSRIFWGVICFTQGESVRICFASSTFHWEIALSFHEGSSAPEGSTAALSNNAARPSEQNHSVRNMEPWTSLRACSHSSQPKASNRQALVLSGDIGFSHEKRLNKRAPKRTFR